MTATMALPDMIAAVKAAGYRVTKPSTTRKPTTLTGKQHALCVDHIAVEGYRRKVCIVDGEVNGERISLDESFAVEVARIDVAAMRLRSLRAERVKRHEEHRELAARGVTVSGSGGSYVSSTGRPDCWDCAVEYRNGAMVSTPNDGRNNHTIQPSVLMRCGNPETHDKDSHACQKKPIAA